MANNVLLLQGDTDVSFTFAGVGDQIVVRGNHTNEADTPTFDDNVVNMTGAGSQITFENGTLLSFGAGAALNIAEAVTVDIGAESNVIGASVGLAVTTASGALTLVNSGHIRGTSSGINIASAATATQSITNYGDISGGTAYFVSNTTSSSIHNYGAIRANTASGDALNLGANDTINNYGSMFGVAKLFTGTDILFNSGDMRGDTAILGTTGNKTITNAGTITTTLTDAITVGAGTDTIVNSGHILGNINLGGGTDRITNTGTMSGDIVVNGAAGGNKTIFNTGLISTTSTYAASLGAGNDSITNSGFIQGDIDLADGTDKIVNSGTIVGRINIDTGTGGNKTIINTGTISNPFIQGITFGSGDDRIVNYGLIERLVQLGDGSDTYLALDGGAAQFAINGAAGTDSLTGGGSSDRFGGGADSDTLKGNGGDDVLDGGTGNDTMQGGAGNDQYTVDSALDVIIESAGEGSDTVNTTVNLTLAAGAEIEFLTNTLGTGLTLIGNATVQTITGGAFNDTLGGGGNGDTLVGLAGNDTYALGAFSATIIDSAGTADLVTSTITRSLAVFTTVENLTLLSGNINGTGNALANTITGNTGNNVLNGGVDALVDTLIGLAGNDTYVLGASTNDVVQEIAGVAGGVDTAISTIARSLAVGGLVNVENLTLLGAGNGTGNNLNNIITGSGSVNTLSGGIGNDTLVGGAGIDTLIGGTGNDTLIGGIGIDTLTGGAGNDFFVFNAPLSAANRDNVAGFSAPLDTFHLENAVMTGLGAAGALNANAFFAGAAANDASDRIIYNQATGVLLYDSNGNLAGGVTQLATLTTVKPVLTAADFVVI